VTAVIGVTSIPRWAQTAFARLPHETVPELYLDMVARSGGTPVVLPVHQEPEEELLDRLDGILLTGGGDVEPDRYGDVPRPETSGVDGRRDRMEIEITRWALERDLPVLAICRGIQVLNVALGGTLIQDLEGEIPGAVRHWYPERWGDPCHEVHINPSSRLAGLVGRTVEVNSMHHQAVREPARTLRAVGRAPDGVIEAVEAPDQRFCVGLQWHAECLGPGHPSFRVFEEFVRSTERVRR